MFQVPILMPAISRDGSSPANYYNDGIGDGWGQRAFCVQNEMYADHPMKWPKRHRSLLELWALREITSLYKTKTY